MDKSLGRREVLRFTGFGFAALLVPGPGAARPAQGGFAVSKSAAEWRRLLGSARFAVLREGSTERPFTSPLDKERRRGTFACAGCAQPLFVSTAKFDSGTGWPSFFKALPGGIATRPDRSHGTVRTEVLCQRCGGHLGHLFRDGPKPTGLRYCMNGLALKFRPA
jgi:peptide-methionine (R)-S-oxide reductase